MLLQRLLQLISIAGLGSAAAAGLALAVWIASAAQTGGALSALTVPEKNLPAGCALKPWVPPTTSVVQDGKIVVRGSLGWSSPFPRNPWSGQDRALVIAVRKDIDPAPRLPDAPPPSANEISALEHAWVAHVIEAYRATYVSADGIAVWVNAIRFDAAALAEAAPLASLTGASRGASDRFAVGSAVVRVWADSKTECFQAVDAHVRSLK